MTKIETLDGKALVAQGSTVTEGQLLISGVVDTDGSGVRLLHGMGSVWARTWYELSVLVPLQTVQYVQQVEESGRVWLNLGKNSIKFRAKGSKLTSDCGKILDYGAVYLPGGFRLPITVVKEQTVRYVMQEMQRSEAVARTEGEAVLLEQLQAELAEGDSITSTRFSAACKGDYLLVTLWAECHQQIGREVVLPLS